MRAVEKLLASKRLLAHVSRDFAPIALFQSFSVEDMVLTDLIYDDLVHQEYANITMFTIDTGRLPEESHRLMDQLRQRYGDVLKVYYPDAAQLEAVDNQYRFRDDYQQRSYEVRLLNPLKRALGNFNAWLSGSDALQESTNAGALISWDSSHQIPRFNPLSRWSEDEIRSYLKHRGLPVHRHILAASDGYNYQPNAGLWWWQSTPERAWETSRNIA